jgi:hypothetical protein
MLVTFSCPAYADVTFFGDVAVRLLKLMGQSGHVPGALLAEDVAAALGRLEEAVEAEKQRHEAEAAAKRQDREEQEKREEDEQEKRVVDLSHRAFPLIRLLRAAAREEVDVIWMEGT